MNFKGLQSFPTWQTWHILAGVAFEELKLKHWSKGLWSSSTSLHCTYFQPFYDLNYLQICPMLSLVGAFSDGLKHELSKWCNGNNIGFQFVFMCFLKMMISLTSWLAYLKFSLYFRCSSCKSKSTCCNKIYLTQNLILNDKTYSEPTTTIINSSLEIPEQETSCTFSAGKHQEATFPFYQTSFW